MFVVVTEPAEKSGAVPEINSPLSLCRKQTRFSRRRRGCRRHRGLATRRFSGSRWRWRCGRLAGRADRLGTGAGFSQAIQKFGFRFLTRSTWDPVAEQYGALPFIFGTLVSSFIALLIAVPLSVATAVYLTELAPLWMRQPLVSLIEMLAAVPSVILGLWGIFVMVPWLRDYLFPCLKRCSVDCRCFKDRSTGVSMLAGGIIVAIMIVPIITSVSREILRSVPDLQREAAYALGATRWEVTRIAVLGYARKGLFGAVILGLGRALGETMAVTMVIGNTPQIAASLFARATRWPA